MKIILKVSHINREVKDNTFGSVRSETISIYLSVVFVRGLSVVPVDSSCWK
jgi:hypothetical protein